MITQQTVVRPGEKAPRSGEYIIVGPRGKSYGVRVVTKGKPLPPTPKRGQRYTLRREIKTTYTTAASVAAMDETMAVFDAALTRLAKR